MPAGLLFVYSRGEAKIVWHEEVGSEVSPPKPQKGDIAGLETFFDISLETTSLIALPPVQFSLYK
jgi:hypothetical protein